MARCAISLGGNVGEVTRTFQDATQRLLASHAITSWTMSRVSRTAPMGASAGEPFLNAAAAFDTELSPWALLDLLQQVESDCGRVRTIHWGPRTLDLDLLLYGGEVIKTPRLTIPHPGLWHRRFVLDPLVELLPKVVHPVFQETIGDLRDRLLVRPLPVALISSAADSLDWVEAVMSAEERLSVLASPELKWIMGPSQQSELPAILFTGAGAADLSARQIPVPADLAQALPVIADVLTAALDEPQPI